jgi:hypothetical protein
MSDNNKKDTLSVSGYYDDFLVNLTNDWAETTEVDTTEKVEVDTSKNLGAVTGIYGKISNFLDVGQLAQEAEEYMSSGQDLVKEWSPDTWAGSNIDVKGWDRMSRQFAKEYALQGVETPGFGNYYKGRAKEGVYGFADDYFYNLALSDVYSSAAAQIKKVNPRKWKKWQGEIKTDQGASSFNPIGIDYDKYKWDTHVDAVNKFATEKEIKELNELASLRASGWAKDYRKDLNKTIQGTIDDITKGEVSRSNGQMIESLNEMLSNTESLQTIYNTKEEVHLISKRNNMERTPGADKILKNAHMKALSNLEAAGKDMAEVYDRDNIIHREIMDATKLIKEPPK